MSIDHTLLPCVGVTQSIPLVGTVFACSTFQMDQNTHADQPTSWVFFNLAGASRFSLGTGD